MSEILEDIGYLANKLKSIYDYIDELEKENQSCNIQFDTYEIVEPVKTIMYIYSPHITYMEQPKCDKCDKDRLLSVDNTTTNNFKMCICSKLLPFYQTYKIPIHMVEKSNGFDILHTMQGSKEVLINNNFVLDKFSEKDTLVNLRFIYYRSKEDCEKYCNFINKENGYEI